MQTIQRDGFWWDFNDAQLIFSQLGLKGLLTAVVPAGFYNNTKCTVTSSALANLDYVPGFFLSTFLNPPVF